MIEVNHFKNCLIAQST